MTVFIFGMIGPLNGLCVHLCLSLHVCEREKSREEAHLWLLFKYIKINIF